MISNDCNDKRNDVTNPQEMEMEERKKQMEERQLKENLCLLEFIDMFWRKNICKALSLTRVIVVPNDLLACHMWKRLREDF